MPTFPTDYRDFARKLKKSRKNYNYTWKKSRKNWNLQAFFLENQRNILYIRLGKIQKNSRKCEKVVDKRKKVCYNKGALRREPRKEGQKMRYYIVDYQGTVHGEADNKELAKAKMECLFTAAEIKENEIEIIEG